jgi:hypothetical protein
VLRATRRAAYVSAAVAVVFSGAGCSSASSHSPVAGRSSASKLQACDLLTVAAIKKVTGVVLPSGQASSRSTAGASICNWEDIRALAAVQVQLAVGDGRAQFKERRNELAALGLNEPQSVRVAGAEAAYQVADQGVVDVLTTGAFIQVSTVGGAFDEREHLALAEVAIERLTA